MSKNSVNKSPERHTFQEKGYIERCKKEGKEPNESYINMFKSFRQQDEENLDNPKWQENNLEYDLRSTKWICDKAKSSDHYAQNLYAAMCNMQFQKLSVVPILKEEKWSCSWRSSGGIVADMREEGDYIDWYCSGMSNEEYGNGLDGTKPELDRYGRNYVLEGTVTEEIELDLKQLGWIPVPWPEDDK